MKPGDKVHVKLPNGVEWEDVIEKDSGMGIWWFLEKSKISVLEDWLVPLEPEMIFPVGTLVKGVLVEGGRKVYGKYLRYECKGQDGGFIYIIETANCGEMRCSRLNPVAIKIRKWEDLTQKEKLDYWRKEAGVGYQEHKYMPWFDEAMKAAKRSYDHAIEIMARGCDYYIAEGI